MDLRLRSLPLVLASVWALAACQLTDHSGSDGEIGADLLEIPASGYDPKDASVLAAFRFDSTVIDMGRIAQGEQVEKTFRFVNSGSKELLISDVRGTCGCTVGKDWPKQPVKPGQGGTITVRFDSEGRGGHQLKTVTVVANTQPPTTVLTLKGEVMAPPGSAVIE